MGGPYTGYYVAPLVTTNLAQSSSALASSQVDPQTADRAIDLVATGYPADYRNEWVSGSGIGAWIELNWTRSLETVTTNRVTLFDRPNLVDQITSGTLTFSDGSTIDVGPLNNDGTATSISFPAKTTSTLRFTVTGSRTNGAGLAEFQVWGTDMAEPARLATLLPPGITLNNRTGAFSGTPTTPGSYPFLAIASGGTFPKIAQTLDVNAAPTTTTTPGTASTPTPAAPAQTPAPTVTPATTAARSPIVLAAVPTSGQGTPASTNPGTTNPATTTPATTNPATTTPATTNPVSTGPATPVPGSPSASSTPASPTATPVSPTDARPQASVEAGGHVEGQAVTITGSGYRPGSVVTVVLPSTGATLGTATADRNGTFSLIATLPVGTTGKLMVRVLGVSVENGPSTLDTSIVVSPSAAQELAFTGTNTMEVAVAGAGLLLAGLAITRRARKRRI